MDLMDESSGEVNPYIDSSVGALVWVRRRNGSWWPGRILGPEELPGSHLLSPRTGTPVKLLGREDGSVDWYNIEKSRRVKAFRCGEFDECIERARSLASALTKKREKYARREDAILHALELEKQHVEQSLLQDCVFSVDRNYDQLSNFADAGKVSSDDMGGVAHQASFPGSFTAEMAEASLDDFFSLYGHRKYLDADWEDITETIPHMRGLQNLGLRVMPSKERKDNWSTAYEHMHAPQVPLTEDDNKVARCMFKTDLTPMTNRSCVLKKKRPVQVGSREVESTYKKQDRKKTVSQIVGSGAKLGDGALDLGFKSTFSPFFMNAGRNGYGLLQPKQEKQTDLLDKVPFESKTSKSWCDAEILHASQVESRCRHDTFSFPPHMDKACSSFSNQTNLSCCQVRSNTDSGSQMEAPSVKGSAFVDSLLQNGPASRCLSLPGTPYARPLIHESDAGLENSRSLLMAGYLPSPPPSNFLSWPSHGQTEAVLKLVNEPGLRGQTTSIKATCLPDYPFEGAVQSTTPPLYSVYKNRVEGSAYLHRQRTHEGEGSVLYSRNYENADMVKGSMNPLSHCLSPVAEDNAREGSSTGEDEADSTQLIPGSSLSSPEAVDALGACNYPKHKPFLEEKNGSPNLLNEPKTQSEGCNFDSTICGLVGNGGLHDMAEWHVSSRWPAKGRRMARVRPRNMWGLAPMSGSTMQVEEIAEEVHMVHSNVKRIERSIRRPRYTSDLDSSSEDEDKLFKEASESSQRATDNAVADHSKFKVLDVSKAHNCVLATWVNVPVEMQDASSRAEHVPLVSIMSNLIGKPIVGHAVLVERIEKRHGSSQKDASRNASSTIIVKEPPWHPAWRTGRRTAMQRIPRSVSTVGSLDQARAALDERQYQELSGHQNRAKLKNDTRCGSASTKHHKKFGTLPQKTRMLSSIASNRNMEIVASKGLDPPVVTCIPVNVIFNRIREVLYRGTF